MRNFFARWIAVWLGAVALINSPLPAYAQDGSAPRAAVGGAVPPVALIGVTVIDVETGARRTGVTVLTQGDRIAALGPRITLPPGASRVSGKGKFLIPGLWDMHSHHQGTGAESLDLFVAKGVVGTRDMGGDAAFILPLRDRVKAGAVFGPEIVASGPMVDNAPPDFPYRLHVTNAEEARLAVRELKRLGVDFIKVHDHTPREVFFAAAAEASQLGLTVSGHVPVAVKVEEAADADIRSIEHLANYEVLGECSTGETYSLSTCLRLFDKLAAKGVWQTPTLAFFQTLPDVFEGQSLRHAEYANDSLLELTRQNIEVSHVPQASLDKLRYAARVALQQGIHDLYSRGNRFLAGCDGLVPGFCLHDELEWFTKAGFSPLEALQTATINPARFLGRDKLQGTIEVGKRADLVLLDADPLADIRNVQRIDAVILRGKLVNRSTIDRIIAKHRRAEAQ
jgi:hypothetical protein